MFKLQDSNKIAKLVQILSDELDYNRAYHNYNASTHGYGRDR